MLDRLILKAIKDLFVTVKKNKKTSRAIAERLSEFAIVNWQSMRKILFGVLEQCSQKDLDAEQETLQKLLKAALGEDWRYLQRAIEREKQLSTTSKN